MNVKVFIAVGIAASSLLAGGWAVAQTLPHDQGGGTSHGVRGHGAGGMRHGMGHGMGHHGGRVMMREHGMGPGAGPGRMGMMGMMGQGSATPAELGEIHDMLVNHDRIKRTVTNLPDGIRTTTESDDPQIAAVIASHVAGMDERVREGRDPKLPIQSPTLQVIFRNRDKIITTHQATEKGIVVVQTSSDPETVAALQKHASEVSDLARRGMVAAHENIAKNAETGPSGTFGRSHRH
jgi:hypothetical protein